MLLPRTHISYSQMILWQKSPDQYRKRYYEGEDGFSTIQTRFGHKIHKMLEEQNEHPFRNKIKIGSMPEHKIRVYIDGVPCYGIIDSFFPESFYFKDFKTGHKNKKGLPPWDAVKVLKLKQLVFYAVLIDERYDLNKENVSQCSLDWIETQKVKGIKQGPLKQADSLELTGFTKNFPRSITAFEKQEMRKEIVKTAQEISTDYASYLQNIEL